MRADDGRLRRPAWDVLELIETSRMRIPGELDDAQDVLDARDSMLQDAKTHADSMVSPATTSRRSRYSTTPAPRLTDPV